MQIESILNLLAQPQWNFPQFNQGTTHKSNIKTGILSFVIHVFEHLQILLHLCCLFICAINNTFFYLIKSDKFDVWQLTASATSSVDLFVCYFSRV